MESNLSLENSQEVLLGIRPRKIQKLCVEIRGRLGNLIKISEGKAKEKGGSAETVQRLTEEINERFELLLKIKDFLGIDKDLQKSIFDEFIARETNNGSRQNRASSINTTGRADEYLTSIMAIAGVSPMITEHFLLHIIHRNIEKRSHE